MHSQGHLACVAEAQRSGDGSQFERAVTMALHSNQSVSARKSRACPALGQSTLARERPGVLLSHADIGRHPPCGEPVALARSH